MGCVQSSKKDVVESNNQPKEAPSTDDKLKSKPIISSVDSKSAPANISGHADKFGNLVDDTGARIWSDDYYKARADADNYAKLRGKCFEDSKVAFSEDRKADAKSLSDEGKKYGQMMEEANKKAVLEILGPQHLESNNKIDLHGLYVQEAVDATRDFVKKSIGKQKTIEIITGQGLHSDKNKGPVIKPAIIDMCKQEQWKLDNDSNNPGSFILHVPDK